MLAVLSLCCLIGDVNALTKIEIFDSGESLVLAVVLGFGVCFFPFRFCVGAVVLVVSDLTIMPLLHGAIS